MRIKWKNIFKIIAFIVLLSVLLHDWYYLVFKGAMLTYFGVLTEIICVILMEFIYEDLEDQIKALTSKEISAKQQ